MRRKLLQLSTLLCLGLTTSMAETRIMVISDPHIFSPENCSKVDPIDDNKLNHYSFDIFSKAVENTIEAKPDLLLITGDLTCYGEKSGHESAHEILKKATDAGITVKVIPGNHDIMDPYSIDPDSATVTPSEFAEIYSDMAYDSIVARDSNSLSWAASINDKLAIIGLDANIYDGDYHSDGCLRKSTLNWMKAQADSFHKQDKMVIAMVHYEIMDHFTKEVTYMGFKLNVPQSTALPNSILNITNKHNPTVTEGEDAEDVTLDDVQIAFADADIHYVLTGHFHVNNTAKKSVKKSDGSEFDLYDLSTGGLSTYPCFMRTVVVNEEEGTVNSTSTLVEMPLDNGESDLQSKAKEAVSILDGSFEEYGFTISGLIEEYMAEEPYELYDATEIYQDKSYTFPSLTYTRIFDDNNWQTLYVPFASNYSDWSDNFDIALPVQSKAGAMFFNAVTDTNKVYPANSLALIRLKSDKATGRYSIKPSSTEIAPDTSTLAFTDCNLTGVYSETLGQDHHVTYKNKFTLVSDSSVIKPMRWYLDNTYSYNFDEISLYVDNVESYVSNLKRASLISDDKTYRVDGSLVKNNTELPHGLYIINGKKTIK